MEVKVWIKRKKFHYNGKIETTFVVRHRGHCITYLVESDRSPYIQNPDYHKQFFKPKRDSKHTQPSSPLECLIVTGKTPEVLYLMGINNKRRMRVEYRLRKKEHEEYVAQYYTALKEKEETQLEAHRARVMISTGHYLPTEYIYDLQERLGIRRGSNYL